MNKCIIRGEKVTKKFVSGDIEVIAVNEID